MIVPAVLYKVATCVLSRLSTFFEFNWFHICFLLFRCFEPCPICCHHYWSCKTAPLIASVSFNRQTKNKCCKKLHRCARSRLAPPASNFFTSSIAPPHFGRFLTGAPDIVSLSQQWAPSTDGLFPRLFGNFHTFANVAIFCESLTRLLIAPRK